MERTMIAGKTRPHWHVDAKWVFGLLLTAVVSGGLLVYGLYQLTGRGSATRMIAPGIGAYQSGMLSADARTALKVIEADTLSRAARNPNDQYQLLPMFNLMATGREIALFTPEALEAYTAQRVAEVIYDNGAGGLAGIMAGQSRIPIDVGFLGALGPEVHPALGRIAVVWGVAALILLVPVVIFSAGFGRLGSPGVALTVAALPGVLVASVLAAIPAAASGAAGAADPVGIVMAVATQVIAVAARSVLPVYGQALLIGLALADSAVVLDWTWRIVQRVRRRPARAAGSGLA
jgi:hypothetical protein